MQSPASYSFRMKLGPQDGVSNIFHWLDDDYEDLEAAGIDWAD
jgi:hypothetical protein